MKAISKWMHENHYLVDNNRNFLIAVSDPCDRSTFGDPTSLDLILMGFSGCISSEFNKIASKNNVFYSDLVTEVLVNQGAKNHHLAFDIVLRIKTSSGKNKIQECLNKAISLCPFGILTSSLAIPTKTHIIIENNIIKPIYSNNKVSHN